MKSLYNNSKLLVDVNHGINNINNTIEDIKPNHSNIVLDRLSKCGQLTLQYNDIYSYIIQDLGNNWIDILCEALKLYRINYMIYNKYDTSINTQYKSAYTGCKYYNPTEFFNTLIRKYGITDILLDLVYQVYDDLYRYAKNINAAYNSKYDYIDLCSNKVYKVSTRYGSAKKYIMSVLAKLHNESKLLLELVCNHITLKSVYNYDNTDTNNIMLPNNDFALKSYDIMNLCKVLDVMAKYDNTFKYSNMVLSNEQAVYDCINGINYTTIKPNIDKCNDLHVNDYLKDDYIVIEYDAAYIPTIAMSIEFDSFSCKILYYRTNYYATNKSGILAIKSSRYDYLRYLLLYRGIKDITKCTPADKDFYSDNRIKFYRLADKYNITGDNK